MSQFCGSFCALRSRSLLTVGLYSAAGAEATSARTETLAKAAQPSLTRLRARLEVRREAKRGRTLRVTLRMIFKLPCGRLLRALHGRDKEPKAYRARADRAMLQSCCNRGQVAVARMERLRNPGPAHPHCAYAPCGLRRLTASAPR